MKVFVVSLADQDGNRDPESAWHCLQGFSDLNDAQKFFREQVYEAIEDNSDEDTQTTTKEPWGYKINVGGWDISVNTEDGSHGRGWAGDEDSLVHQVLAEIG